MQIEIEINGVKPVTLNHYTKITTRGKFASKYKPKESIEFEKAIDKELSKYQRYFDKFNGCYDSSSHYLVLDYQFYIPLFTKKGLISKKSGDVDNFCKPIQDRLFNYLSADDSEVVSVTITKIHSKDYKIAINIMIRSLNNIK